MLAIQFLPNGTAVQNFFLQTNRFIIELFTLGNKTLLLSPQFPLTSPSPPHPHVPQQGHIVVHHHQPLQCVRGHVGPGGPAVVAACAKYPIALTARHRVVKCSVVKCSVL